MDMKTKTIVTAMLLATAYVLLVNLMFLSGFGKDEMVKVGWYSEFGGNSTTTLYPLYVWLNFPYTVCFYFFTTLFFAKVKVHVNKWLGETDVYKRQAEFPVFATVRYKGRWWLTVT